MNKLSRKLILPILALALVLALRGVIFTAAQGVELLRNNGMDEYTGGPGGVVPVGWTLTSNVPVTSAKQNWVFNEFPGFVASWQVSTSSYAFTMTASQFVAGIRSGTPLRFSAFANLFTCNRQDSCIGNNGARTSEQASGARVRIGVDPTGGRDPNAASVVWSPFASPFDTFQQLTVDVTSANDNGVTVFLYATQAQGFLLNNVYWDNASLLSGAGNPAVPPTERPRDVPFVTPQATQSDGSIIHIVREGDTLLSIAVAYNITIGELRRLNEIPEDEYVVRPGDRLIIKPPSPNVTYVVVTATFTPDPNRPTPTATFTPSPTFPPLPTGSGIGVTVIAITVQPRGGIPTNTPRFRSPTPQSNHLGTDDPTGVAIAAAPSGTPQPAATITPRPSNTPELTVAPTQALDGSATIGTDTLSNTATLTPQVVLIIITPTLAASFTPTFTQTPTITNTVLPTVTKTFTQTPAPTRTVPPPDTETPSPTLEPTVILILPSLVTATPARATATNTALTLTTETSTITPTPSDTSTPIGISTATLTPSRTVTLTPSNTPIPPTETPYPTNTRQPTEVIAFAPTANVPVIAPVSVGDGETTLLCVTAYDDANTNRVRDSGEPLLTGMSLQLRREAETIAEKTTNVGAQTCFTELAAGDYTLHATPPDNYGMTTPAQIALSLPRGAALTASFGAASGFTATQPPDAGNVPPKTISPSDSDALLNSLSQNAGILLLIVAGIVLVSGIGLALIIRRR